MSEAMIGWAAISAITGASPARTAFASNGTGSPQRVDLLQHVMSCAPGAGTCYRTCRTCRTCRMERNEIDVRGESPRMQLPVWPRVSATILLAGATLLGPVTGVASAQTASQDSVTGSGSAGTGTFVINAVSGPLGEQPSGTVTYDLAIGTLAGTVTCVNVTGNLATVGGVVDEGSTAASPGSGFIVHVQDGQDGEPDLLRLELLGAPPVACPDANLISPSAVTGSIEVVDAVAPATQINQLIGRIEGYVLDGGTRTSLLAKLKAAAEAETPAQCSQLQAFVNQVKALSGSKLTVDQATELSASAALIRAALACAG
jgi:hypothetical protein